MLESLSESLRNIQFVDQKSLASAFNLLQGFSSRESVSNFSIAPLPIPGVKQETINTTGNATSSGVPLPDTTKQTTTNDRPGFTPQAPTLDTVPAFSGFTPSYGENPSDLLSDQVNLTYQIFNLRMLLERSLSDRLLTNEKTRRQAVLGFNVTLDPPRTAENAVAVVEIRVKIDNTSPDGLSLVSVMPQEKTYNAAALSTKSKAFSGAAVAKVFQVGYSQRERSQIFYLYRDNDTVSYERMNPDNPNEIIFGWMFRPVLGRKSVSPGLRQLFAIVALPAEDEKDSDKTLNPKLDASVVTYWKKYDRETMTSFEERDSGRINKLLYGLSFNLAKPEIFSSRYVNAIDYSNVEVKTTTDYQTSLKPEISRLWWVPVGSKSVLISADGNNFFSGTQVVIGDKTYTDSSNGLIIKSNQGFDLTTTLEALASSPGAIIGRYGNAIPLVANSGNLEYDSIRIGDSRLSLSLAGNRSLEIDLYGVKDNRAKPLEISKLPKDPSGNVWQPIVTVNGNPVQFPYTLVEDSIVIPGRLILQTNIPDSFLSNEGGIIKVTYPFLPSGWTATQRISNPDAAFQIVRLSKNTIILTKTDYIGFTKNRQGQEASSPFCWHLRASDSVIALKSKVCPTGSAESQAISDNAIAVTLSTEIPDKIALVDTYGAAYILNVPKLPAGNSDKDSEPKPIPLNQYDSLWIDVTVKEPAKVSSVEVNLTKLQWRQNPAKEGETAKSIKVLVPREITLKPGDLDLSVLDKDGKTIGSARLHITCIECDKK